jgi:hypothetical protein
MPLIKTAQEIIKKKMQEPSHSGFMVEVSNKKEEDNEPLMTSKATEEEKKQAKEVKDKIKKEGGSAVLSKETGLRYTAPGEMSTRDGKAPEEFEKNDILNKNSKPNGIERMKGDQSDDILNKNSKSNGRERMKVTEEEKKDWEEKQNKKKEQKENFYYQKLDEGKVQKMKKI